MEPLRSPRLPPPPCDDGEIVVEAPPDVPKDPPANLVGRLLPVAMLLAMGGMTVLYFTSGAASSRSPMFLFFPVMMLVSVLGSVVHQSRGMRRGGELDEDRRSYLRYLDELDAMLARVAVAQHASLHWSHPDPASLWSLVGSARVWERRPGDVDFCQVRMGVGSRPIATPLVGPELDKAGTGDPVTAGAVARLLADRSTVPDLPITVDLTSHRRIAVQGEIDAARAMVRGMVCQLVVFHGPHDVDLGVIGAAAETHWDWLKWLPHHGRSSGGHRIVIVDGDVGGLEATAVGDGATAVTIGGRPEGDCLRLDVDDATVLEPDSMSPTEAVVCARALAPYLPSATPGGVPTWTELIGIGDPLRVDVGRAWRTRPARQRLRVPVGVSDGGAPVDVDVKEAARGGMGPHGLCVGATGSGKSEFLRTLVLGMVATHGPDELNLVLVDFKGGATFLGTNSQELPLYSFHACSDLHPHLRGPHRPRTRRGQTARGQSSPRRQTRLASHQNL
jgi:S-DNA-T family DNA segregation ATPase FtsK/SpoIIIE